HSSLSPYVHRRDLQASPTRRSSDLGQDWPLPLHEIVQIAMKFYHFCPRTEHQVEGIAEDDLRTGIHHISRQHAFHGAIRSEEHTSELQSRENLVCRLLLEKKKATGSDESIP